MHEKEGYVEVSLPNGSSHVFHNVNGTYVGEGSRASLVVNNGEYILTTQDQYKYGFDANSGVMNYMQDKNGNRITLAYNSGKLVSITDTVGRFYTLDYNGNSLLSSVTDPAGRVVKYEYTNNLLTKVTDPQGGSLTYEYDSSQYLTKLIDQNNHTFQQLVYNHTYGDWENKVVQSTDADGATWYYAYDLKKRTATITDKGSKTWVYYFDTAMYTIRVKDPEGKSTYTEYAYQDMNTYYGDVKATIDRNGNRTDYEVDDKTGNVTKITRPDGGITVKKYDKWNNVIEETTQVIKKTFTTESLEVINRTYYKYDTAGSKLLMIVQPVNGKDDYDYGDNPDTAKYIVTKYTYFANGLLQTETDPEGNTITYSYNQYGDTTSVTDATGNIINYSYNNIGQVLSELTSEGYLTKWNYDNNGLVIREIHPDGGIKRTVYDLTGRNTLDINPNQYDTAKDNTDTGAYTGAVGNKYSYFDNGNLKSTTDAEGNVTSYTYDKYGNKQTETKPSGGIYRYEYDVMERLTKTYYKENASATEVLLQETSYSTLSTGDTQTNITSYADNTTKSTTSIIKDYADREIEKWNPDGGIEKTIFNPEGTINQTVAANGAITYYNYDALGNATNVWAPMSIQDGATMYSWTGYTYNKAGDITEERKGKSLVKLNVTTSDIFKKNYKYIRGYLTEESDSDGRKTTYTYDKDGRASGVTKYVTATTTQVTNTKYNYLGKPVSFTKKVRKGDTIDFAYDNNEIRDITSTYQYDLNGNLTTVDNSNNYLTTYTYDKLNRILTTSKKLYENSVWKDVVTSKTYTWDGQLATETDARNHTTKYTYDNRGNQTKIVDALGKITLKAYDRMGRNTAIVSPKNYKASVVISDMERTEFAYNSMNMVEKQTEIYKKMKRDSSFNWTGSMVSVPTKTYQYDTLGNVISTTDALGNVSTTDYNLAGMKESITDAQSKEDGIAYTIAYTYNGLGQTIKETYPNAYYSYTYDGAGNLLTTSVNDKAKSSAQYDLLNRAISITDGNNYVTTQKWNAFDNLAEVTTPGDLTIPSNRTIYQYNFMGWLTSTKDSKGVLTTNGLDTLGRNISKTITNAAGTTSIKTSTTYDANGNVLTETDGRNNTTTYTYDDLDRKATAKNALNQTTTYTYDDNSNLTAETNYLGNTTKKMYDGINRLIEIKDAGSNIVQQILYNDADAQISSFDALGNQTQFLYDKNLRQIGTIDGKLKTSSMVYDARGNISTKTDARGNTTTYTYDGENNLLSVKDALNNITSYTYDNNGNKITQKDGNGNITSYNYNVANKLITKTDPADNGVAGLSETYTYYYNGLMATKIDRNKVTTTYTYDDFGRLIIENAGGETQSYTYDNNSNMLTMTDASGFTTRTYDALNRNITKIVPGIGTSTYAYDLSTGTAGEYMEQTTDPKGNITKKIYDKVGKLAKVTAGGETTGYEYYKNGRQFKVTYANKTTETYYYDANNQVTKLVNAKVDGSVISSYQYEYDAAGNQTKKIEAKGTTTYTYDKLNRLDSVTEPIVVNSVSASKITSYLYDGAGNRKSEKVTIGDKYTNTLYSYNALNRLTATLNSSGEETSYLYDNNGNLLNKSIGASTMETLSDTMQVGDDSSVQAELPSFDLVITTTSDFGTGTKNLTQYTYNKFNRLTTMKDEDSTASYVYNAQGYRVEKTVNGQTTDYLYEADKVVLETDKSGNQKAVQVYGNNLLSRSVTGAEKYYYLYNAHGDVTSLINTSGVVAASYDYDAFGNIINKTGVADNSILYAGYQHDDESGLYYLNARYYDSVTARFITEDTYTGQANDPLSLNLYTYCNNEPIMYDDPSGNFAESVGVGFGFGLAPSVGPPVGLVSPVGPPIGLGLIGIQFAMGLGGGLLDGFSGLSNKDEKSLGKSSTQVFCSSQNSEITKQKVTKKKNSNKKNKEKTNSNNGGKTLEELYDLKPDTMKNQPIQISVTGNTVNIKVYVNFTGDANENFDDMYTYKALAREGIYEWATDIEGTDYDFGEGIKGNVEVQIIEKPSGKKDKNNSDQKYLEIHIDTSEPTFGDFIVGGFTGDEDYNHISHCESNGDWSTSEPGKIHLFNRYKLRTYSADEFRGVMAHELGHALGLADAYPNANGGKTLKDNAEIENGETGTIMWDNGTVSSNDIEMVLEAFKTNKEQYYMNYKGHKKSGVIRVKQKFKK